MNSSDKTYLLYKSVFNNIYLVKKIFKIARGINRQVTNSNNKNNSFTQRLRYNEATFCWIVNNNYFELLYDKIQVDVEFGDTEIQENELKLFIQHLNNNNIYNNKNNIILNKFYQKNKKQIKSLFIKDGKEGLLSFSIKTNNLEFVKISNKDFIDSNDNKFMEDFSGDSYCLLLDLAFKSGNLDIVKYIKNETKHYETYLSNKSIEQELQLISDVLESSNRDEFLLYLLNELKFNPKSKKLNETNNHKLILLEFNLFQRLYNLGWIDSLAEKIKQNSIINKFGSMTVNCSQFLSYNHHNNQLISLNTFLNYLQNGLYFLSQSKQSDSSQYTQTLKKINNLILTHHYSNNNNNNKKDEEKNTFIFEREIKRIYLFDFLKKIKDLVLLMNEGWVSFVINFTCQYGEYHYLIKEIQKLDENPSTISSIIITVSMKYADSHLINQIPILFSKKNQNFEYNKAITISHLILLPADKFFDPKSISVAKQLDYLETLFKFNIKVKETILKHIINNTVQELTITDFNKISRIVKSYYINLNFKSTQFEILSGELLVGNEKLFKYCFENHKDLFKWDNESISKIIIKSNNLQLIEYIHTNSIGSINKQISINHSETIHVAKFMYEKLGYRFSGSLNNISELNEWESGYLFYYAMNQLITFNNLLESEPRIDISIGLGVYRNFKQRKYIHNLYTTGLLNNSNLIGFQSAQKLNTLFESINDINFVFSTGNCKYIKELIKNQPFLLLNLFSSYRNSFSNLQSKNKRNKSISFINNEIIKYCNKGDKI
ncbi:hypothetical protein RB653_001511 [Dictyostelium firmibasis]|uniref:Uncharacterized protein n=1 Tax=Dictyostelium firmibasis TaxID=79012 RepID=A0AAN7UGT8_9MYCE